jgi:hypothetical protein
MYKQSFCKQILEIIDILLLYSKKLKAFVWLTISIWKFFLGYKNLNCECYLSSYIKSIKFMQIH